MADIRPTRKQATISDIKIFTIGRPDDHGDFTYEEVEQMVIDLAKWFAAPESGMSYIDPLDTARAKIRECMLAVKSDGSVWNQAPNDFRKRLKIKANYDYEAKRGVPVKTRQRVREDRKSTRLNSSHG